MHHRRLISIYTPIQFYNSTIIVNVPPINGTGIMMKTMRDRCNCNDCFHKNGEYPSLYRVLTRGLRALTSRCIGLTVAAITVASSVNALPNSVDFDLAEPRITTPDDSLVMPLERPDPSLMLPIAPQAMVLPEPRPTREELYPPTTITLEEGVERITGIAPQSDSAPLQLRSGEGMAQMLRRGGLTPEEAQEAISRISSHLSMRSLPVGFEVTVMPASDSHGAALRLMLEDDLDLTLVETTDGSWLREVSLRPVERYLTYVSGSISSSLYRAGIKAGMTDDVFNTFVQVLGFSVDFQREVRKGDEFEVLFESSKDIISGKTVTGSRLHYISMTLSGDKIEFFHHDHQDGGSGWYDEGGNSAARTLMRTPVNGARLSSGYGQRKHPVLGYSKMHRGIDFAASIGTPIMAAGSGVIEYAGRNGSYGNYVRIRHNSTYKTAYAHLSKVKTGISPGTRVSQGEIIGYVGNTGRSTGPHLHYEILVNNRQVNPLTVRLPAGKSMPEEERLYFDRTVNSISDELTARGILRFAGE